MPLSAGLRVLVAEDNLTNQRAILGLLRKIGIEATVVANGMDAVEACQRKSFDLVLIDCQMPTLDGYGATRLILQNLDSAAPPILLEQLRNAVAEFCVSTTPHESPPLIGRGK